MYSDRRTAVVYDLIHESRGKDYRAEAKQVAELVRRHRPEAHTLLDVACGTGLHLAAFAELGFEVTGLDVSPAMLDAARSRVPGAPLLVADMRTFRLDRRFDVVTCLFSSIAYMTTGDELAEAIANLADHLVPGGVLVVEPWVPRDIWHGGIVDADSAWNDEVAVGQVCRTDWDGDCGVMELRYVVATPDRIETFDEHHRLGLFDVDDHLAAFAKAGLAADHDPVGLTGRGLFVAVTPG